MTVTIISLSAFDLALAAGLIVLLAAISIFMRLGLERQLLVAGLRTTVQLLLIGLVLKALFASAGPGWIAVMALVMLAAAGREVSARQQRRFSGWWRTGIGTVAMLISSYTVTIFALVMVIGADPWYRPQYAVPLLGMLLGNTMNGIAIGLDRLTSTAVDQRAVIRTRLALGQSWRQAVEDVSRASIRSGLIPIINSMMVAGLVSLPGMMTGQILGGNPPMEAVKYQVLIMFLIAGGTGLGTMAAVWMGSRRLFDHRQRLRIDRLETR